MYRDIAGMYREPTIGIRCFRVPKLGVPFDFAGPDNTEHIFVGVFLNLLVRPLCMENTSS